MRQLRNLHEMHQISIRPQLRSSICTIIAVDDVLKHGGEKMPIMNMKETIMNYDNRREWGKEWSIDTNRGMIQARIE